jgi:predicted nucleic acid-binding protein
MPEEQDCTFELFDSSVFVEAIANTSGKQDSARDAINSVVNAQNRIPIVHQLIVGEVKGFLRSGYFEDELSRKMAGERFEKYMEDFRLVSFSLENFNEELEFILNNKGRIASEFNDSLIVAMGLSTDKIDKIHTTDQEWNLKQRSNTKINSI